MIISLLVGKRTKSAGDQKNIFSLYYFLLLACSVANCFLEESVCTFNYTYCQTCVPMSCVSTCSQCFHAHIWSFCSCLQLLVHKSPSACSLWVYLSQPCFPNYLVFPSVFKSCDSLPLCPVLNVIFVLLPCSMFPCVRYNKGYCVWWTPRLFVLNSLRIVTRTFMFICIVLFTIHTVSKLLHRKRSLHFQCTLWCYSFS